MKTTTNTIYPAFALFAFAYFALSPTAQAVSPPPDGGYPGRNTAEVKNALFSLTTGLDDTAVGFQALLRNTTGVSNTATGTDALQSNKTANNNTAIGVLALQNNDTSGLGMGSFNTAVGAQALLSNVDGNSNNAVGFNALGANVDGLFNQAMGFDALSANTSGAANIAIGDTALLNNISGSFNTVIGYAAGSDLADGNDNIYIGATAGNGFGNESGHIRIGDPNFVSTCFIAGISGVLVTGDPVVVNGDGQLGVARAGSPLSANELLNERRMVQELQATAEKQAARIALQESQIQTVTAALKQQAELEWTLAEQQRQIDALTAGLQKVSAQLTAASPSGGGLELSKSEPQKVVDNR